MANQDVNGTVSYWTEGTSSTLIKARTITPVSQQVYWYNGNTDGFLTGLTQQKNARAFYVLIGF